MTPDMHAHPTLKPASLGPGKGLRWGVCSRKEGAFNPFFNIEGVQRLSRYCTIGAAL